MNGRGIQKPEELNGRGPKNEASNPGGIKIEPWMGGALNISGATCHFRPK